MPGSQIIRRRNLPHWDVPTAAYFVTTCLEGSIPARGLLDLDAYRTELAKRPRPADQDELEWRLTQSNSPSRAWTRGWIEEKPRDTLRTSGWPESWLMRSASSPDDATTCWVLLSCPAIFIGCFNRWNRGSRACNRGSGC